MADPHLDEIEELVQASVFHPSPCRRLRARVLHGAVQARHRQRISHRVLGAMAALAVSAAILFVAARHFSAAAPEPPAVRAETGSTADRPSQKTAAPAPGASLGETLYRGEAGDQR